MNDLVKRGWAPESCSLTEVQVRPLWFHAVRGHDPCIGCHADRAVCKGRSEGDPPPLAILVARRRAGGWPLPIEPPRGRGMDTQLGDVVGAGELARVPFDSRRPPLVTRLIEESGPSLGRDPARLNSRPRFFKDPKLGDDG